MHKEALATYKGPPATILDYVEAIPSEEEFEYLDYAIQQLRKDNINLNALPDKERWAVMDRIIAEYAEHKNTHTSRAKQVQKTSMQAALEEEREALSQTEWSRFTVTAMIVFVSITLDTSKTKSSVLMSPESGFFWMTARFSLFATPPVSGAFSSNKKAPRRTSTRSVRKRVMTTTATNSIQRLR